VCGYIYLCINFNFLSVILIIFYSREGQIPNTKLRFVFNFATRTSLMTIAIFANVFFAL